MLKNFKVKETTSASSFQVITGDIGDWMEKKAAKSKVEFEDVFDEWYKARGNGEEARTLQMFINIGDTERAATYIHEEYYGKKLEVILHKIKEGKAIYKKFGLLAIIEVIWNNKVLYLGIQEMHLNKEQTHDHTGKYYDVTLNEHIGLALQLDLSFNNAWFQMWRTVWFSGEISNVNVAKVYRILD